MSPETRGRAWGMASAWLRSPPLGRAPMRPRSHGPGPSGPPTGPRVGSLWPATPGTPRDCGGTVLNRLSPLPPSLPFLPRRPSWAGLYASCTHGGRPGPLLCCSRGRHLSAESATSSPPGPSVGTVLPSHRPAPHPSRPNGVLDSQAWPGPTEKVVCPRGPRWRPLVPGSHSLSR